MLAVVFDDVGARVALVVRELAVANQAVGPVVDDFDFEFVLAGFDSRRRRACGVAEGKSQAQKGGKNQVIPFHRYALSIPRTTSVSAR